jgi:hypothetical protein
MLKRMNQEHWKHQGRTTVQNHPETKYVLKTKQKTVFHFPVTTNTINTCSHFLEKQTSYQLDSCVNQGSRFINGGL